MFQPHAWEPSIQNPYRGMVIWTVPENVESLVTLFRDPRVTEYEDKEWTFVIEDVSGDNSDDDFDDGYEFT